MTSFVLAYHGCDPVVAEKAVNDGAGMLRKHRGLISVNKDSKRFRAITT